VAVHPPVLIPLGSHLAECVTRASAQDSHSSQAHQPDHASKHDAALCPSKALQLVHVRCATCIVHDTENRDEAHPFLGNLCCEKHYQL
jgi:hypothetical protein